MGSSSSERRAAVHHGSLRPGRTPRRSLAGPRLREQSQEGERGRADASSDLDAADDQPAAPGLPQFWASPAFAGRLRVDCLCQGEARLLVSPRTGLAIPADRAHGGCVNGDLGALP
eukprot:s4231_g11.t1